MFSQGLSIRSRALLRLVIFQELYHGSLAIPRVFSLDPNPIDPNPHDPNSPYYNTPGYDLFDLNPLGPNFEVAYHHDSKVTKPLISLVIDLLGTSSLSRIVWPQVFLHMTTKIVEDENI